MLPTCARARMDASYIRLNFWCVFIKCQIDEQTKFLEEAHFNRMTRNDSYMGRTAPLTSKRCILYINPTNTGTEYFKHALYSPFFSLQNAVRFMTLISLFPALFTFNIQDVLTYLLTNSMEQGPS